MGSLNEIAVDVKLLWWCFKYKIKYKTQRLDVVGLMMKRFEEIIWRKYCFLFFSWNK